MRSDIPAAFRSLPDFTALLSSADRVVGVGLDVTDVEELRLSLERFGDRYLRRIFSEREVRYCYTSADPAPCLAARHAAKEGVMKALGTVDPQPDWPTMETLAGERGWHRVEVSGRAARAAGRLGAHRIWAGLSADDRVAVALVLAVAAR